MNDPGWDGSINEASNNIDRADTALDVLEEEEEKAFIEPSQWWFAKTACPLIAGTFGPMANAFSICALSQHWREHLPNNRPELQGETIPDPPWLYAVNGVSLVFALTANVTLLLNMADRMKFSIAQSMTVSGFYLASLLLIGCIGAASSASFRVYPAADEALTQAYYYGIWAAALYMIIAILMTFTVYGAIKGKYPKRFALTTSQRTLMLQTISFMAYLLIGALIFSHVENWRYLDALYWADITLLTIGFGDQLVPISHTGRSLLIPFTIGGILAVGLIIGSIRSMLLEQGKMKMNARTTENKRKRVKSIDQVFSSALPGKHFHVPKTIPEKERRRLEFHAMKRVQERAHRERQWTALTLSLTAAAILWFIGAVIYYHTEYEQGWTYFTAIYFTWVALISLGYGDYQPMSNSGRAFFVLWSLLAVPTLTVLISDMGDTIVKGVVDVTNWIGSVTILPGEVGKRTAMVRSWNQVIKKMAGVPPFLNRRGVEDNNPDDSKGREASNDNADTNGDEAETGNSTNQLKLPVAHISKTKPKSVHDILLERMSENDKAVCTTWHTDRQPIQLTADQGFYHWVLAREIKNVLVDTTEQPPKKYTYDEWAYFLKLIGHDEENPYIHAAPNPRPKPQGPDDLPQLGTIFNRDGTLRPWSWLGFRSPLLSHKEEADWILHQLVTKLRRELEKDSRPDHSVPHITLSTFASEQVQTDGEPP